MFLLVKTLFIATPLRSIIGNLPEDLDKFAEIGKKHLELAMKFFDYYNSIFAEGELIEREKALIALAVAHAEISILY